MGGQQKNPLDILRVYSEVYEGFTSSFKCHVKNNALLWLWCFRFIDWKDIKRAQRKTEVKTHRKFFKKNYVI